MSDNGGVSSGDDYATSNLPLRGGKGYQWEAGTRIPFLIKVSNIKNTVKIVNTPVMGADLFPTLLAGLENPYNVDGKSVPSLKMKFWRATLLALSPLWQPRWRSMCNHTKWRLEINSLF